MASYLWKEFWTINNGLRCSVLFAVLVFVLGDDSSKSTPSPSSAPTFKDFYFSLEPTDTVALKDHPAYLNCSVTSDPSLSSPRITWKKEGAVLNFIGDARRSILPNGSLYFSSIYHTRSERPDEGIYQCVATVPELGTIISRSAKLQVALLPRFDDQPSNQMTFPGQTAFFPCLISGVPPATIQWLKDERPLQVDPSRMTLLPSGALEIDHVQVTDKGGYVCNASNIEKHRISSSGTLSVSLNYDEANKISAPVFLATPRNTLVIEGTNATLDCAANGNPRPKIQWLKDGVTIDMSHLDSRFSIVGVGSLQIENVRESDEGSYMCRAENHEDSVDSSANIEVEVPPRFIKQPQNRYAYEKEDMELECEIYGKREPQVQWFKDGEKVIENEYFQIVNNFNLRILGLVKDDRGVYQCVASNSAGNIQASAQLVILDPDSPLPTTLVSITTPTSGEQPRSKDVPSLPQDVKAVIVSTRFATLSWQAPVRTNGNIFAYSVYYKEEGSTRERVINTTRPRLEEVSVQGLRPATKYFFRVIAYNQHGPGETSQEVTVVTHPEVHVPGSPKNLKAAAQSPSTVLVQWEPPEQRSDPILNYKLYYMEVGTSEEHEVVTSEVNNLLRGLKKFCDYSIWVVAYNKNGPGLSTEEVVVRTYSDVPSDMPQNVTAEAASSNSIILRWEPPPKEMQNGVITGYKIRFKLKGSRRGDTVTTDGNRRLFVLQSLERGAQYSIKISALTVNGSGPGTDWVIVETYQNDLNEKRVPEQPSSIRGKPTSNSIYVTWTPPENQNIMIRGYTIGWGIGIPDVYSKILDGKQRYYTIENLQPSSEYVISLRAFNQMGDGPPAYNTVKTLLETTPEPLTPMIPPVGLKAIVLSSSTVVLYWTDSTLSRNQVVTDNRFYTVRYTSFSYQNNPKYKYFNSTELNCMIDDLKPNTQYEFAVKVVKGRRESTYSMTAFNTTQEAAPSSPPRDLTAVMNDNPTIVSLHWQPPKQPNGQITGYVIFYTTDNTRQDRDWVVEGVVGDKMTTMIKGLTADTVYYFKIQARNNKGYGPFSSEISFQSGPDNGVPSGASLQDGAGITNNMLYIIIACVSGVTLIIIIAVSAIVCRRRQGYLGPSRNKGYGANKGKASGKELKPPDLWIHHDHMELKALDKGQNGGEQALTVTPIPRNSQDLGDEPIITTMEKKKATYMGSTYEASDDKGEETGLLVRRSIRVKPIMIPIETQPLNRNEQPMSSVITQVPNGTLNQPPPPPQHIDNGSGTLTRPLYPRTQYNIPRAHVTIDASHQVATELPSPSSHSQVGPVTYEQVTGVMAPVGTDQAPPSYSSALASTPSAGQDIGGGGTMTKRQIGHPLKSFSVPAPPPQSGATTPQPKHPIGSNVRPQVVMSPLKKTLSSSTLPGSTSSPIQAQSTGSLIKSRPTTGTVTARPLPENQSRLLGKEELTQSYSTEELNQEMANLEGLMKDLNAITASEFEC